MDRFYRLSAGSPWLQALPLLLLLMGLLAALAAGWSEQRRIDAGAQAEFDRIVARRADDIAARFGGAVYGLAGGRGAMATHERPRRDVFRRYVATRDLEREFPGVRGLGYIQRVAREDLPAFVAEQRADGAPQFALRRLGPDAAGDAADHHVITYIEPADRNRGAMGLDVGSEPQRRDGLLRALATGQAAITGVVTLVQDERRSPGVLVYLPLVPRPDTAAARRIVAGGAHPAREGVLYAPIVVAELLGHLAEGADARARVELFDNADGRADGPLYFDSLPPAAAAAAAPATPPGPAPVPATARASAPAAANTAPPTVPDAAPRFERVVPVALPGRTATLRVTSTAAFEAAYPVTRAWWAALGVLTVAALLASLLRQQILRRGQAETMARRMTVDLQRLALVAERTSNAVVITDARRRIVWVNEGFVRLSGFGAEEVRGHRPGALLQCAETDAATVAAMGAALDAGRAFRGELCNRARDGRRYWLDIDIQPLADDHGGLSGFMAIQTDITERKHAETALQASQALLNHTGRIAGVGGWSLDAATLEMAWSDEARRLIELPAASPTDRTPPLAELLARCPARSRRRLQAAVARAVRHGEGFDLELPLVTAAGRTAWLRVIGEAGRHGLRAARVRGALHDVTARHQLQAEIERQGNVLRGAIDAIDEAFVLYDPDDRLVLCNERYRELYAGVADLIVPGVKFETLVRAGATRGDYVGAVGRVEAWVAERLAQHRASDAPVLQRLADGRTLRIIERKLPDGHIVGFRVDISDLANATAQAEQASVAKSRFLANMSHEIRTPMNAVLGMLALLRRTPLTPRQADYAAKSDGAARSLLRLLDDILDFSKIEAGKLTLDPQPFAVETLLRDLGVILSAGVGDKPLEVLFEVDPALPPLLVGDVLRLQQVFVNLGGNAVKFTPAGEVLVALRVVARTAGAVTLRVAVSDTGIGIAPEHHDRIFSGFAQAEASTTRRFGGTGLGVAISQRLVQLMGSRLELDSAPGHGSRFHFTLTLPVAGATAEAAAAADAADAADAAGAPGASIAAPAAAATSPTPAAPRPCHALVVDDHPTARRVLRHACAQHGWAVDGADSGAQALQRLAARRGTDTAHDVVFLDWQMPGLDGWETARRLHAAAAAAGRAAPLVVMVTAHGHDRLEQRGPAEQALIDGFLVKPVTAAMLAEAVGAARRARDAPTAADAAVAPAASPRRLAGLRLLLTEDNPHNQQVACELLQDEGATVRVANDGREAVEALATGGAAAFDAVLMDLQMPVMDGFTATARIRHDLGLLRLPIVAMTANASASDREACLAAGMNDHIGKPFDLDRLVAVLLQFARPGAATAASPSAGGAAATGGAPATAAAALPAATRQAAAAAGVELVAALQRMGGKHALYARSLRDFAAELPALAQTLARQRADGVDGERARSLHTLKGLAGTLGATALAALAARAEAETAHPAARSDGTPAFDELLRQLPAQPPLLRALLQTLPAGAPPAAPRSGHADADPAAAAPAPAAVAAHPAAVPAADRPVDTTERLTALEALLAAGDMGATALAEAWRAESGAAAPSWLAGLDDAVQALDYPLALALCRARRQPGCP